TQARPQPTVTINPSFQAQLTQVPAAPAYRCGAWSSNNAPGAYSSIDIYAKLTKSVAGVSGAAASAVVHFKYMDITLDQRPTSDSGGFVTFTLPLEGREPHQVPATVDVSFTVAGKRIVCTPAFFTPQ
ncbi:MAG TPA: hypothetical protein VKR06_14230, partial [Ktedonosporobacter sp.]|nr:hypothetical protein [Ktedonosporobacter sp.]